MRENLIVGTILKPQGIRGELKVKPYTDSPEDFKEFKNLYLDGEKRRVLSVRVGDGMVFLGLSGVPDRNAAELLRGKNLELDRDEAKGHLFRAGSIGEVAQLAGIDAAALEATIAEYNALFEDGVERDPEYYRYTGNNKPFTGGTYYAMVTTNVVLATVGGLTINANAQVVDTSGNPIPGLYATGNASGSFYSGNYPRHIPGTSVGRAATFGYVAADHMVNGGQA